MQLMLRWAQAEAPAGSTVEVLRLPGRTPVLHGRRPGRRGRLRADVRPPRQAAGVHRLVGRPRPVDPGDPRRQALWPRRRRRRLRAVLVDRRDPRAARAEDSPRPLRRADRGQRGKRQPRPARPHRRAGRAPRHAEPGRLPRRRVRQLRAALVHHLAARQPDRHAARRRADRRRALRHGQRHRAVEHARAARTARARRGHALRRHPGR